MGEDSCSRGCGFVSQCLTVLVTLSIVSALPDVTFGKWRVLLVFYIAVKKTSGRLNVVFRRNDKEHCCE